MFLCDYFQYGILHLESDFLASIFDDIDALVIVLIARAWVAGKEVVKGGYLLGRKAVAETVWNKDLKWWFLCRFLRESSACIGNGIDVGEVGLDVEDGSAIHEVGTCDKKHGTFRRGGLYAKQLDDGKSNGVGTER